jgi:hypothetical protein
MDRGTFKVSVESLNRFLIENVPVGDHCLEWRPSLVLLPEASLGRPLQEDAVETQGRGRGMGRAGNGWLCPEVR